ncbi:30S ribosomal protein S8 [Candidatus Saccharibacteria bacterium]|nr:30S ribosomal protein S8 [Candidatus Saccharibacteria bacterium]
MALLSTDPIADLLTRIRNAAMAGKTTVTVPYSKQKETISRELARAKYLSTVEVEGDGVAKAIVLSLAGPDENIAFTEIARISKPGRRVYVSAADIPRIKNGRGIVIISTSKGMMTGQEARKQRLGGEVICSIY